VGAGGGAARNRQNRSSANAYDLRFSASYEIDFWGKNTAAADAAKAMAEASRFDQETVRLTILSSVAGAYVDILATRERLAIARQGVANAERLLDAIRKRFAQGMVSGLEVAQQETVTANQRAAIPALELRLRQSENALALLLGRLPEANPVPDAKLAEIAIPVIAPGLPSELLLRRPDVQFAEARLKAASANITAARAAFFPSIGLTAAGGYQSAALSSLCNPGSALFTLAASVAQSIFEGGRLTGTLERERARYDELLHNYQQTVIAAFTDVEDALAAAQQSAAAEDARRAAAESARKAFALAERRLEGGIVDITSVLDTQRSLFAAEDALAEAKLSHLQALIGLYKALGGGWKLGN
ncbi:MAG: efflux transporter outer membrane subunit, partial [Alphaproteobacteria bacterium]|nr:efflux transporter outer membrane subunit [Alphaproteobacteria bacterium]